ncbi:promotilin isoform X1 [Pelobates cultripes]|uniref:Promotilin isoform X1 n=1 Tax=Pelobates cultripes TaxID=61616 RepID=A0AAD1R2U9_PELCU|nr:promotilin isoform X1 [Pelobates cultripes]CAH2221417.1 promotilin isoform X1 [Pelobates cultripes]
MDSRTVISLFLVIYGICMLAEKTQGSFAHFYSHSDVCNMQQRSKNRACKKLVQRSEEGDVRGGSNSMEEGDVENKEVIKMMAPLEIDVRLDSRQIEIYRDIVEGIFGEEDQQP